VKILLVEDNPDDQYLAKRELEKLGHSVLVAENGTRAIDTYAQENPDLVVTDIYMAGMDGFKLTQAIQQMVAPRWQPVIFLTGHLDEDLQLKALLAGADAYIIKPLDSRMLDARLRVIERLLQSQRHAETRTVELESYYAADAEEKRVAQHLIQRLVKAEKLADPAIRHWIYPAETFSGDLLAAARTPGGALHVLQADGMGHGLSAFVNVLPVTSPFYSMTEKGFSIDAIARELNRKVREFLPHDRFVAAVLAEVDFREGTVRVWQGGMPEPILIDATGHPERVFSLAHAPLGVLGDGEFDDSTEAHAFRTASQLILYSDGVIEAENDLGEMFGLQRLADTLVNAPAAGRLDAVVDALVGHLRGCPSRDDISLLMVSSSEDIVATDQVESRAIAHAAEPGRWRFSLRLGGAELRKLDVVPLLLGLLGQFEGLNDRTGELFVILSELFNNALDHGLLGLDSRRKMGPDGMETYLSERARRLATLCDGEVELTVEQYMDRGRGWLAVSCQDSGPGFDYAATMRKAPAIGELPFGRGISLVRSMADEIKFNDSGNAITAILALTV
jgi:CheY-like chemotaxis protein/anti-sigma regulatory factor (Ser/Thr protein kinase)